jgi:hypothetical protein
MMAIHIQLDMDRVEGDHFPHGRINPKIFWERQAIHSLKHTMVDMMDIHVLT